MQWYRWFVYLQFKTGHWERERRPGPYLLGHISVERLYISPSHLQHSETVAVIDSLPQHPTPAQTEMTLKAKYTAKPYTIHVHMPPVWNFKQCLTLNLSLFKQIK